MKLITKALAKKLPAIRGQEEKGLEAVAYVKLFTPWTNYTWFITEYDPETGECFGLVHGHVKEVGTFLLPELEEVRGPFGLKIERDMWFDPTPLNQL